MPKQTDPRQDPDVPAGMSIDMLKDLHLLTRDGQLNADARRKLKLKGDAFPAANVGRSHPDFGTTMSEHMELQAGRAAEAAKQVRVYMPERRGAR